jgi:hypothetical protein
VARFPRIYQTQQVINEGVPFLVVVAKGEGFLKLVNGENGGAVGVFIDLFGQVF